MTLLTKEDINNMNKDELADKYLEMQYRLAVLEERMAIAQSKKYGRSSEKFVDAEELTIFNEIEANVDENTPEPTTEEVVVTYKRKKQKGKREEDLKNFPVRVVNHEITEEELFAEFGEDGYKRLPDEVYKKLEVTPAVYEVVEHHVAVYASKKDDRIVKASRPAALLNNSIATPSLVAGILNGKYTNAMPLYRIEQEFERNDVAISRQTMSNWVIKCSERYLSLLYEKLHEIIKTKTIIQCDETPVEVSKDGRSAGSKSYMWVYRTGEFEEKNPIVLFSYEKNRNTQKPEEFLRGYIGAIECDGYSAYHKLGRDNPNITVGNCWAHARRSFADAIKASKAPQGTAFDTSIAKTALVKIHEIYEAEEKLKVFIPKERKKHRQKSVKPLVDGYFAWIKEVQDKILPQSATGQGLKYSINQEPYLREFLEHGDMPIDNSASERSIRPFTIGRKNFVLIDTIAGAEASAVAYSIVETAKANNLKPYEYFKHLLTEIPKHMEDKDTSFIDELLPWSLKLPSECRKKDK